MVFVPRMPLGRDLLGLGTSVARAVPSDLLVALASRFAPADIVQKLILAGIFVLGGWGAARLAAGASIPGEATGARLAPAAAAAGCAAAAALFVWNAHVYERLLMGHWALLVSYAALPWVVRAALDYRAGRARVHRLVAALAVAACGSPPGSVIAAATALAVVAGRPWRRAGAVLAAALVLNLPWLLPSLLRPGGVPVRPAGAAAFASRPDGPFGTLGSLLGLGGIWNSLVTPPGHGLWAWWPGFAVVLVVAVVGWREILRRWDRGAAIGLLAAAAIGLLLASAYAVPALRGALDFTIAHVPGGGMIRDAQKFVAPLALVEAIGFGAGVERVLALLSPGRWRAVAAVALVAAPVLLEPGLAWGAAGRLGTATYPRQWRQARQVMAADPQAGAMLVLPWHLYMGLPWNGDRVVLDPAAAGAGHPLRAGAQGGGVGRVHSAAGRSAAAARRRGPGAVPGSRSGLRRAVRRAAGHAGGRRRPARTHHSGVGVDRGATGSSPLAAPAAIVRAGRRREPSMSPTVRVFISLAVGALLLAFAASLTLVTASSSEPTSKRPLVIYGR